MRIVMPKTSLIAPLLLLTFTSTARADTDSTYVYQRTPAASAATEVSVELDSAVGTREARPFGAQGVEQAARVELRRGIFTVAVRGGALIHDGQVHGGVLVDAGALLLQQGAAPVDVHVSAGVLRDYRQDIAVRATVTAGRSWGRLNLSALAMTEIPLAADRDAVDVVFGLGGSALVRDGLRLGGELIGEDLEGFWDENEAEGGARLLIGPTVWFAPGRQTQVKLNAAAFIAPGLGGEPDSGALIRLVLGRKY
jgi:hypothetical protein